MQPSPRSLRATGFVFCLIFLNISLVAEAQQSTSPKSSPANIDIFSPELVRQLESIKTAALADDYAYHQLAHLTENIGPRPSGSPAAKAAIEYVAAQLRDLGLEVHLEEVKVPHWTRGLESAELVAGPAFPPGTQRKVVVSTLGGSASTGSDGITADLVVVDNFDQLQSLGRNQVAGKIVLFNTKFDEQKAEAGQGFAAYREVVGYREAGPTQAARLGAAGALVRSIGNSNYRLPHTGDSERAGIPAASVCAEDADLMAHLVAQGPLRMRLTLNPQKLPDEISYNVIADLKGSEHPEQIVIVSAHLDSWDLGTGALDDGTGVVLAMQSVRVLQQLHLQPKRTLRFIAWMDEETDGSGSQQYLKDHQGQLTNHVAAMESDTGAAHPFGFALRMNSSAVEQLKPLQSVLASIGSTLFEQTMRAPGTTDIAPLAEQGVPVISILQDMRTYYGYHHTAADTFDKVVPSELRENAAAMAVMAYALTNMKNPLPR